MTKTDNNGMNFSFFNQILVIKFFTNLLIKFYVCQSLVVLFIFFLN